MRLTGLPYSVQLVSSGLLFCWLLLLPVQYVGVDGLQWGSLLVVAVLSLLLLALDEVRQRSICKAYAGAVCTPLRAPSTGEHACHCGIAEWLAAGTQHVIPGTLHPAFALHLPFSHNHQVANQLEDCWYSLPMGRMMDRGFEDIKR